MLYTLIKYGLLTNQSTRRFLSIAGFHLTSCGQVGVYSYNKRIFWLFLLFGTPTWPLCLLLFVTLILRLCKNQEYYNVL